MDLSKKTMENGFLLLIPYQFIIARFPVSSLCLCLSKSTNFESFQSTFMVWNYFSRHFVMKCG